jgi:hypothetical protein
MKPVDKAPGGGGRPEKRRKPAASKCAVCGKPAVRAYRPFCSKRCADIDLGRWLKGGYAVPGTPGEAGDPAAGEE